MGDGVKMVVEPCGGVGWSGSGEEVVTERRRVVLECLTSSGVQLVVAVAKEMVVVVAGDGCGGCGAAPAARVRILMYF